MGNSSMPVTTSPGAAGEVDRRQGDDAGGQLVRLLAQAIVGQAFRQMQIQETNCQGESKGKPPEAPAACRNHPNGVGLDGSG
jgi:hypothetical protein